MAEVKDLERILEIISLAIVRQETEEAFFRRSAASSTSQDAKNLFTEIADDMARCRKNLDDRKDKLFQALSSTRNPREQ